MAGHGGKRKGAGRKPGAVANAKRQLADEAKQHTDKALKTLVHLLEHGETGSVKLNAANALLDRAYGKPFVSKAPDEENADAPTLNINISAAAPVGDVRVTQSDD